VRRTTDVMGMPVTVDVRDPEAATAALDEVYADLAWVDSVFSTYRPGSAISRINDGTLSIERSEPVVRDVLALCDRYERETDGYFSAWREGRFDPSGLVKGWAIERAAAILDRHGYADYFVDAAGDVRTRGHAGPDSPWRVGIRHPIERDKVVRVIHATDLAVATSGTYEKGAHIFDPHTGEPATDLLSLTIVGPDIVTADVLATAVFAMGHAGLAFVEDREGYEAYAIDPQLRGHWTSGFDRYCER
jgi:FAD:protein FMN transferase